MEYGNLLGNSLKTVLNNYIAYATATVIVFFGSILFITAPPLLYGYIMMLTKGARNEIVNGMDVLDGFRNGNFVRSWKYMLFMMIISVVIMIAAIILLIIGGIIGFVIIYAAGSALPESVSIAIMVLIYLVVLCIVLIPAFFMMYVLPLYVIKGYEVTEALSESIQLVKENIITSVIISLIAGLVALVGSLPYYAGFFLGWPVYFNLLIYIIGILITMPLSQQILVNTTLELGSFPELVGESDE
jgi:membrane-anchored glycerophosphoryl diester phosphodiesterase (GDPDase)